MIREFLSAANISNVVWVDDFFAAISRDEAANRIEKYLLAAKERGLSLDTISELSGINLKKTAGEIREQFGIVQEDWSDQKMAATESALAILVGADAAEEQSQSDLSPEEFAELQTAFGANLKTFSVRQWTSEAATQYANTADTTLFVIDKEFNRESPGFDGLKILKDLVDRPNSYCIILTHTCSPGEQDTRRLSFAREANVGPHQFCVVSKVQKPITETIDIRFGRAIYEVFTHFLTARLAHVLAKAVSSATLEAVKELSSESIHDIDRAIFENSIDQGASEVDVLLRIFRIRQKPKVNASIQTDEAQTALRQVREFRVRTTKLRDQLGGTDIDLKTFRAWRRDEIVDDPYTLNLLHTPLSCGDLFDVTLSDATVKKYVLLAQPCDLTVRGDEGRRTGEVGMLVPIKETEKTKKKKANNLPSATVKPATEEDEQEVDEESPYKFFDIKDVFAGEKIWRADFRSTIFVPLKVLDLAVFNRDGTVQILRDHPTPLVIISPAWQRRLETARGWFKCTNKSKPAPPIKLPSAIGKGAGSLEPKLDPTSMIYPMKRSGRLERSVANAVYAAWSIYQTRAAFAHDFAKPAEEHNTAPACIVR